MILFARIAPDGKVDGLTNGDYSWPWIARPQEWVEAPEWVRLGHQYDRETNQFTEGQT